MEVQVLFWPCFWTDGIICQMTLAGLIIKEDTRKLNCAVWIIWNSLELWASEIRLIIIHIVFALTTSCQCKMSDLILDLFLDTIMMGWYKKDYGTEFLNLSVMVWFELWLLVCKTLIILDLIYYAKYRQGNICKWCVKCTHILFKFGVAFVYIVRYWRL